jgi:periplasmic protein TonB
MLDRALGGKSPLLSRSSLPGRIRENFESLWKVRWAALPAGEAPVHLLDERRPRGSSAAQLGSTCLHLLAAAALVSLALGPGPERVRQPLAKHRGIDRLPDPRNWLGDGRLGLTGSSGGHNPLPPTAGELPPRARLALLPPRLPDGAPHPLAVPVTIAQVDAPEVLAVVNPPGLPWMTEKNGSEGQGEHGIGRGLDRGMGMGPGNEVGAGGDPGPYSGAISQVVCRICPDPKYSDQARKEHLQGAVTMRVLVGADGRVKEVRITRGIGLGLDENAVEAVRSWQFLPARDAGRRPVAAWITVETLFRLY